MRSGGKGKLKLGSAVPLRYPFPALAHRKPSQQGIRATFPRAFRVLFSRRDPRKPSSASRQDRWEAPTAPSREPGQRGEHRAAPESGSCPEPRGPLLRSWEAFSLATFCS